MLRVSEDGNRRRESSVADYRQLRQSLLDLQRAADRIFDTISIRTAKEREKLTDLSARIERAKGKIEAISHSKQPVTVKSCARYPSNLTDEDFCPLFNYKDGASGEGFPVARVLVNGGLNKEYGTDGTLELYKFFSETSYESLPFRAQSKETDSSKTFISTKHAIGAPVVSYDSFLEEDQIPKQSPKHQGLPPPPPSLLMNNSSSHGSSKGFSLSPPAKQLQSLKL